MAVAKKCDICGKFYGAYNTDRHKSYPNGIMLIHTTDVGDYVGDCTFDCCPECMDSIVTHIKLLLSNRMDIKKE